MPLVAQLTHEQPVHRVADRAVDADHAAHDQAAGRVWVRQGRHFRCCGGKLSRSLRRGVVWAAVGTVPEGGDQTPKPRREGNAHGPHLVKREGEPQSAASLERRAASVVQGE